MTEYNDYEVEQFKAINDLESKFNEITSPMRSDGESDQRALSIARTQFETSIMYLRKSLFANSDYFKRSFDDENK